MVEPKADLLQFETSTACNAKCSICTHPTMKRKGTAKWSTILNALYHLGFNAKEIAPFGMQEPTLEPRLPNILASARQINPAAKLLIYTNMAHYDEAWWTRIITYELLDNVAISFYGVDKKAYSQIQSPLNLAVVEANIKKLVRLKKRLRMDKPEINLHVLVIPETYGKIRGFIGKWQKILGVNHVGLVHWDSWCGRKPYNETFETSIWGKPEVERAPCPRLWQTMNIHFDGSIVPCCLDSDEVESCGNINIDPQAWYTNSNINRLRQLHIEGRQKEIPLCASCTVWKREHSKEWNMIWRKTVLSVDNLCIK